MTTFLHYFILVYFDQSLKLGKNKPKTEFKKDFKKLKDNTDIIFSNKKFIVFTIDRDVSF